jgi:hypothetical protein
MTRPFILNSVAETYIGTDRRASLEERRHGSESFQYFCDAWLGADELQGFTAALELAGPVLSKVEGPLTGTDPLSYIRTGRLALSIAVLL